MGVPSGPPEPPITIPPAGVPWYKAHAFTALWQAAGYTLILWTLNGLVTNNWDWRQGLAIPLLGAVASAWQAMFKPGVIGMFDFQNKANK